MSSVGDRWFPARGSIPTMLRVYMRPPASRPTHGGDTIVASDAFITDAMSTSAHVTASDWVRRGSGDKDAPEHVEITNDPIDSVLLLSLDIRGEGGRAWRVMMPSGYVVDMREDTFVDALFVNGIAGRTLKGPFRWIKLGSQMRLELVSSKRYSDVVASQQSAKDACVRMQMLQLKPHDLIPGDVCISKSSNEYLRVFLGRCRLSTRTGLGYAWMMISSHAIISNSDIMRYLQESLDHTHAYITVTRDCPMIVRTRHVNIAGCRLPSRFLDGNGQVITCDVSLVT